MQNHASAVAWKQDEEDLFMSTVLHYYVDPRGRTNIDEFQCPLPIDMSGVPEQYRVFIVHPRNANLIVDHIKEVGFGDKCSTPVYIACPLVLQPHPNDDWEEAKTKIRSYFFENPSPLCGGLRRASMTDLTTAMIFKAVNEFAASCVDNVGNLSPVQLAAVVMRNMSKEEFADKLLMTVTAHPLWRRLQWIRFIAPMWFAMLLNMCIDPSLYGCDPMTATAFKRRLGVCDDWEEQMEVGISNLLVTPLLPAFYTPLTEDALAEPTSYFIRYTYQQVHKATASIQSKAQCAGYGLWCGAKKFADYLWLNWVETTFPGGPVTFDAAKFFGPAASDTVNLFDSFVG